MSSEEPPSTHQLLRPVVGAPAKKMPPPGSGAFQGKTGPPMAVGQKTKGKVPPASSGGGKSGPQQPSSILGTSNPKLPPTGSFSDPNGPLSSKPAGGGSRRGSLSNNNPSATTVASGTIVGASERRLDFEEDDVQHRKLDSSADALERMLNGSPDPQSPNPLHQHDTLEAIVELSPGSPIPMAYTASNGPTPYHHHAGDPQEEGPERGRYTSFNTNIFSGNIGGSRVVRQDSLRDIPMVSTDVFRPLPRMSPIRRRGGDPVSDAAPFDPFEAQQAATTAQEAVMHDGLAVHYNPLTGDSRVVSCAPYILRALLRRHRKAQYSKCQAVLRESGQFKALCDLQGRHEMWRGRQRARRSTRRPKKAAVNINKPGSGNSADLDFSSSLSSSFSLSDNDGNDLDSDHIQRQRGGEKVKSRSYAVGLKADRMPVKLLVAGGTSVLDSLLRHNDSSSKYTTTSHHQQLLQQRDSAAQHHLQHQRKGNCTSFTTPTFCAYCGCRFARILIPVMGDTLDPTLSNTTSTNVGLGGVRGGRPDNSTLSILLGSNNHQHLSKDSNTTKKAVVVDYKVESTKYCTTCGRRAPAQPNVGGFGQHLPHNHDGPSNNTRHTSAALHTGQGGSRSGVPHNNYGGGDETPNLEDSFSTIGDDPLLMPSADARRANALQSLWGIAQQQHEAAIRHSRAAASVYNFGEVSGGGGEGNQKHREAKPEMSDCMTQTTIQFGHLTYIPEPPPGAPPAVLSPMDMDDSGVILSHHDVEDVTDGDVDTLDTSPSAAGTSTSTQKKKKASTPQEIFQRKMILLLQSKMAADRVKAAQLGSAAGGSGGGGGDGEQVFSGGGAGLAKSAFLIDQNAKLKLKVDSLQHELDDARHRHMETAREIAKELSRDLEHKYRAQTAELTRLWSTLNTSLE